MNEDPCCHRKPTLTCAAAPHGGEHKASACIMLCQGLAARPIRIAYDDAHINPETYGRCLIIPPPPPDTTLAATSSIPVMTTVEPISAAISLTKVANWDGKSQEIREVLITAFDADDYLECIEDLGAQHIEPLSYINNLDKVGLSSISNRLARFITIGGRSLTRFRTTQNLGDDACGR